MDKNIIILPDGYNGHTAMFYITPIEKSGNSVKLKCAEEGKEYMIRWVDKNTLEDYLNQ